MLYWLISCPERKVSVQFAVFRHCRNCSVHFISCSRWKDNIFFFNVTMNTFTLHIWHRQKLKSLAGNCSSVLPTVQTWPLWTANFLGKHYESDEVVSKPSLCCCQILKWTSTTAAYWSFYSTGRNAWIILGILGNSDRTSPVNVFVSLLLL
jgi:hypothetical protein